MRDSSPFPFVQLLAPLALALALAACGGDANAPVEEQSAAPAAGSDADAGIPPGTAPAAVTANPMAGQFASLGGGMHALAEACGGYSGAELDAMKAEQRDQAIQGGTSAADFDAEFDRGYSEASAKIASGSAQEREKACAQADQLRRMGNPLQAH